jgi:hypothetical protein
MNSEILKACFSGTTQPIIYRSEDGILQLKEMKLQALFASGRIQQSHEKSWLKLQGW